ncbi:hypothetical protein FACS1894102_6290 [Spirochaetia bacterium]|nr:hypothetical protein FACS1894102_6290 [Spirochaetia bacterium]
MNRFFNCNAIVLKQRPLGESNREAFFLTETEGVLRCMVYGGPKSKLKAFVSPFHSGILYVYHDPIRNTYKVQDFDVKNYRMGIRESYERSMTSIAICETVLAGYGGGGNWIEASAIVNASLNAIENADDNDTKRSFVHFLWTWANLLGALPDISGLFKSTENAAILAWLQSDISHDSPAVLSACPMEDTRLESAKGYCLKLLASAYGRFLNSWKW